MNQTSLGSIVKQLRASKGMTLKQFSDLTGYPYTTLSMWENENRQIPIEKFRKIVTDCDHEVVILVVPKHKAGQLGYLVGKVAEAEADVERYLSGNTMQVKM